MRIASLIVLISGLLFGSSSHTFLTNKYEKEIELEAKIVSNIAKSVNKGDIKLYIPNLNDAEKAIYEKYFHIVNSCNDSNFAYFRNSLATLDSCDKNNKVYFTNSYKNLITNDKFIGAFFWSKSRPNVIFLEKRLEQNNITLPKSYDKYIESF